MENGRRKSLIGDREHPIEVLEDRPFVTITTEAWYRKAKDKELWEEIGATFIQKWMAAF